jgi:hypothetical protein
VPCALIGELRKHPERLVEENVTHIGIIIAHIREELTMAYEKKPLTGKVTKIEEKKNGRKKIKFKVEKDKPNNRDADIEIDVDENNTDDFTVESYSTDDLPSTITNPDGSKTNITWFNNFSVKKNGNYNVTYKVTIPGISNLGNSRLVIYHGSGDPQYFSGSISGNTIELTNGDPAVGSGP